MNSPARPARLWLYRTKPRDDELFSSWLVRLAHGLAVKLQTLCAQMLGLKRGFWAADVDRDPDRAALRRLSEATAAPFDRLILTGLAAYDGLLWEAYYPRGPMAWVMPIGRLGRRRKDHGQQFCRRCLLEDPEPYFRRRWRLAFNVICERHCVFLDDACRQCAAPVEFHAGDFGCRLLPFGCPIVRCRTCGGDFRSERCWLDQPAPDELVEFQARLNAALREGWSPLLPGARAYSFLFFDGLRYLVHLLASRSRGGRLRRRMLAWGGQLGLDVSTGRSGPVFEQIRLGDRAEILLWTRELLEAWPGEFVRLCQLARVSSSYIVRYGVATPYWLSSEIAWHLDDRDYAPTDAEKQAAAAYLARRGIPVSANAVHRLLGVAHNPGRGKAMAARRRRWNPRTPLDRRPVPQPNPAMGPPEANRK